MVTGPLLSLRIYETISGVHFSLVFVLGGGWLCGGWVVAWVGVGEGDKSFRASCGSV